MCTSRSASPHAAGSSSSSPLNGGAPCSRGVSSAFPIRHRRMNSCWQCDFPAGETGRAPGRAGPEHHAELSQPARSCTSDRQAQLRRHSPNSRRFSNRRAWHNYRLAHIAPPAFATKRPHESPAPFRPLSCANALTADVSRRLTQSAKESHETPNTAGQNRCGRATMASPAIPTPLFLRGAIDADPRDNGGGIRIRETASRSASPTGRARNAVAH